MAQTVGIVGGGLMGSGIAYVTALKTEATVTVAEQNAELLEAARGRINKLIEGGLKRNAVTEPQAARMRERIRFIEGVANIGPADIIVEAVFEDISLKQQLFEQLDQMYPPSTILASNTSGLSISKIAAATRHPARVVGTHFFNPVPVMKLVEMVRGEQTAEETIAAARRFCESLGKEVVVSADRPGFITTRVGALYLACALRCLEEDVATAEDIDKAIRLAYNFPMGPFQLMDLIGLDTELRIMESLTKELGPEYDPGPILRRMVAENKLGRKTGSGFFPYEKAAKAP